MQRLVPCCLSHSSTVLDTSVDAETFGSELKELITTTHNAIHSSDLLGVELVELRLLSISSPQAQHSGLGTVGHIDQLLVPPAFVHRPDVTAQYNAVVTHLHRMKTKNKHGDDGSARDERHMTLITDTPFTSMKKMSPVVSVPACTTKVCFFMCRLPLGLMESSLPFYVTQYSTRTHNHNMFITVCNSNYLNRSPSNDFMHTHGHTLLIIIKTQ